MRGAYFNETDGQKTLISAERIKQTTPLITGKKPNLVFGLGTDQTHHNFLGPLSYDATTLYTKDSKEEKPRKKIS